MLLNRIQSERTQRNSQRFIPGAEPIALETRHLLATTVIPLPGTWINETVLLNNAGDIVTTLSGVPGEPQFDNTYFIDRIGSAPVLIDYPAGVQSDPNLPLDVQVTALNDAGQVVGTASSLVGPIHGFIFSRQSGSVLIPTLPGGYTSALPNELSPGGLVTGIDLKSGPPEPIFGGASEPDFSTLRGFVYGRKLGLVDLGTLPGLPWLEPTAVNDVSRLVVGVASPPIVDFSAPITTEHAFLYNIARRTARDLGTTPGFDLSAADFVNDRGQVVGVLANRSNVNATHVFYYDPATGMKNVGTLPGFDKMTPIALENDGRVIIQASNGQGPGASRAVEYIPGLGLRDLGALPDMVTTFGPEPGIAKLTPPNKYSQSLVTVEGGFGDTMIYLDDLNTGRLIDLTGMLNVQLLGADSTTRITDAGQFIVSGVGGSPNPNWEGGAFLATLDLKDLPAPQSDLAIAITGLPANVRRGDIVSATITITNDGPDLAGNVQMLENIGPGLQLLSTAGPGTRSVTRTGIRARVRRLPNGASATFVVKLRANQTGLTALGATVLASHDANQTNNTSVIWMPATPRLKSAAQGSRPTFRSLSAPLTA